MARGAHVARRLPIVVDQLFPEAGVAEPRTPLCSLSDIQGWILDVSTLTGVVARLGIFLATESTEHRERGGVER